MRILIWNHKQSLTCTGLFLISHATIALGEGIMPITYKLNPDMQTRGSRF